MSVLLQFTCGSTLTVGRVALAGASDVLDGALTAAAATADSKQQQPALLGAAQQ
jgi:hypothetical protein